MFLLGVALLLAFHAGAADFDQAIAEAAGYQSGSNAAPLRRIEQAVRESAGDRAQRAQVEAGLIKLLAPTASFEAKRFACTQLAIIGPEAALPTLAEMLKNPETAGMACASLAGNKTEVADRVLLQALEAAQGAAKLQIMVTLGDRRVAMAVGHLQNLAQDADRAVQSTAIGALGKVASADALRALAVLRASPDAKAKRLAALASLVAADLTGNGRNVPSGKPIYEELLATSQPLHIRRAAFEGLLRTDADGGEKRCVDTLRGAEADLKPSAIAHVRAIKNPKASATFAAEMSRLTPAEQALMIDSLAARNDAAAKAAITEKILAEDEIVRQAAVVALAKVGDASSVSALAQALAGARNAAAQQTLVMALASLQGGAQVDATILRALPAGATAKPGLINALARRGSKTAVPALLVEAGSAELPTARAAFRALGQLAAFNDLPELLNRLAGLKAPAARGEAETAATKLIERAPDAARRAAAVARALAKTTDLETRCSFISLLPACGGDESLKAVQSALNDQQPAIREAALRALAEWPDAAAIDPLLTVAQSTAQNTERVLALRGSVRLLGAASNYSASDLAARFEKAMSVTRSAGEKKMVLGGLANVHDPVALKLLEPHHADPAVQAEAAFAAVSLAPRLCGAHRETTQAALEKIIALPVETKLKQTVANLLENMGKFDDFILAWQVAGPFMEEGKAGQALFDVIFSPEQANAANVKWQIMPAGVTKGRPWQLDFAQLYGGDNRVAYARAWIYSDKAQPARLELGSDDGIKAWLNGQLVASANRGGDVAPGTEKAAVTLRQGWNPIVLKITQWSAGWGFCARVAKPDGTALPGIRMVNTPPQ